MLLRLLGVALLPLQLLAAPGVRDKHFVPVPYPSISNKTFIQHCLDAHNKHRAEVSPPAANMLYMTWDVALARIARAWANKCIFQHNAIYTVHPDPNLSPTGENLWISGARQKDFDVFSAVRLWYDEVKFYKYQDNSCTRVCGHYTQVVWDTSYKLGCAVVFCRKFNNNEKKMKNIENFVCNYGPAGNYPRRPYKTGKPCSACPKGDTCANNLCRNAERERDNSKRYSRWYPPFEFRIICDDSCITVAILRPLLMFLAFAAVYYLKLRYPGLSLQN